ncbi:MAG: tRNA pseudouridine(38-40) synthase TruA [Deltaproteobacteria bacterium]|nr:tRNA pseudouridine(38-40) synthase TruA [Deltaproteobacteria bacterium]
MEKTFRMILEYDGTDFNGWQSQARGRTVQQVLEKGLHRLLRQKIKVVGASRTDSGVHALGQVAHFKVNWSGSCLGFRPAVLTRSARLGARPSPPAPMSRLRHSLNAVLPDDVVVRQIEEMGASFHAIRLAREKTYLYRIWNHWSRPVLEKDFVWHVREPLDSRAMRKGARYLVGRHDFSAFKGRNSETKTKVRTIYKIKISPSLIQITGNGFLKYMVRNIVGTLVEVGKGRRLPAEVGKILSSKDRRKAGMTAPAHGLFLKEVVY